MKSCQKSPTTFQAVIKISESFRSHIGKCNDRLIISLFMCKVYDQIDVKRGNKCQHFGHWFNECDKQVACSICSESHESKSCPNYKNNAFVNHKCINCSRNGLLPINHKADSPTCPVYKCYKLIYSFIGEPSLQIPAALRILHSVQLVFAIMI